MSATGKTVAEVSATLTGDCGRVVNWMASNQFKLNASKTHLMTVGTGERLSNLDTKVDVIMDGVQLVESKEKCELLLGCELQSDLKWHTQEVEEKTGWPQHSNVYTSIQYEKSSHSGHVQ